MGAAAVPLRASQRPGAADEHGRRAPLRISEADFEVLAEDDLPVGLSARPAPSRQAHHQGARGPIAPRRCSRSRPGPATARLAESTSLHIFVASLRCEHSCPYCQVSRQSSDKEPLRHVLRRPPSKALEMAFRSPSRGDQDRVPGRRAAAQLRADRRDRVRRAERMNEAHGKHLGFVIATNLALLDDAMLEFCGRPRHLHLDLARRARRPPQQKPPSPGRRQLGARRRRDQAGPGDARRRSRLGPDDDHRAQPRPRAGDHRRATSSWGCAEIFLRPLSPYGFAIKTKSYSAYDAERWLAFYEEGLDYILELNAPGRRRSPSTYASIILKKMLTNDDPGYVDLTSPAGIGIGAIVYNYDGDVYASDEGRMLAEMGDTTFRLGNLHADTLRGDHALRRAARSARGVFRAERSDVQRLRLRALLRRRPRLPLRDQRRLPRPKARVGLLPAQHGASSSTCSSATSPTRSAPRPSFDWAEPMIALRGRVGRAAPTSIGP